MRNIVMSGSHETFPLENEREELILVFLCSRLFVVCFPQTGSVPG